jgi:ketosteroid isomerase-like protein
MRIRILHFALVLGLSGFASLLRADEAAEIAQREIDRTVWQPFQCAFEAMDGNALNELYGERVLRVTPEGIDMRGSFKSYNETRFADSQRKGDHIELDFWLDSRATDSTTSYDVGFFRLGTRSSSGIIDYYYGQFHIVLQKQPSGWKIIQDWDTQTIAGHPITAADFARGSAIKSVCPGPDLKNQ